MDRWYFPLRAVRQPDHNGCAIACLATICGLSYERAKAEAFPRRRSFSDNPSIRLDDRRMLAAFRRLGFRATVEPTHEGLRCPCVLYYECDPGIAGSLVHALVWDPFAERCIDPAEDDGKLSAGDQSAALDRWRRTGWSVIAVRGKLAPTRGLVVNAVSLLW